MSQTYLLELTAGALDRDDTGVDLNGHTLRNLKIQVLVDGKHVEDWLATAARTLSWVGKGGVLAAQG